MKFSCKHISSKLSESQDNNISTTEKILIKMHLLMCSSCREFSNQMALIQKSAKKIRYKTQTLSADARARILKNLKK
jgi:predicted anti-sigma-YlaC factor YlaD